VQFMTLRLHLRHREWRSCRPVQGRDRLFCPASDRIILPIAAQYVFHHTSAERDSGCPTTGRMRCAVPQWCCWL
jgi:hypothetical protein